MSQKIDRNQICPLCNSGKKYKKCCLLSQTLSNDEQRRKEDAEFNEWFEKDLAKGRENLANADKP